MFRFNVVVFLNASNKWIGKRNGQLVFSFLRYFMKKKTLSKIFVNYIAASSVVSHLTLVSLHRRLTVLSLISQVILAGSLAIAAKTLHIPTVSEQYNIKNIYINVFFLTLAQFTYFLELRRECIHHKVNLILDQ